MAMRLTQMEPSPFVRARWRVKLLTTTGAIHNQLAISRTVNFLGGKKFMICDSTSFSLFQNASTTI